MDAYEAIKLVMPRIQNLDPENSSKILCSILMQSGGEKEMIRLAFVPEAVLLSYIKQVKASLGLSSDGLCSNPSSPPIRPMSQASPSIMIPNNGFQLGNPPSFPRSSPKPISYADVLSGSRSSTLSGSPSLPFYGSDELFNGQDQLPFVEEAMRDPILSPSGRSDSVIFPYGEDMNMKKNMNSPIPSPQSYTFHRRSFSVNDAAVLSSLEEGSVGGFGWRPCVYYARGFCKNGSSCKFVHGDSGCGESFEMGSPSRVADSGFDEMMRLKALNQQHQKFPFMASGGHLPFHYNKCINFLPGNPRNDFAPMAFRTGENSSLRQIYLTFPADSTFKEDDVFRYFSKFGPVRDVRIPYQQKRMFGFVTFFYPETVKLILAKGNPHFVCDSRVLVKPYKEKGKIADKKQQQYSDRGEYPATLGSSRIDPSELVDLPIGPRMLKNTQEMMRRKNIELEMELQHAIELQGQRMMNLQIMDREIQQSGNCFLPSMLSGMFMSQENTCGDIQVGEFDGRETTKSRSGDENYFLEVVESSANNNALNVINRQHLNDPDSYFPESNYEHTLPDSLFASPTKSTAEHKSIFSHTLADDTTPITNSSSTNPEVLPSNSSLTSRFQ